MNKTFLTLSAAALALTGTALVAQPRGPMADPDANGDGTVTRAEMQTHGDQMFALMDANRDGVIDARDREARRRDMFTKADTDGDGELSQAEMRAMHEARRARDEERRQARADRRIERMGLVFDKLDTDKSGGVSQAELKAMQEARGDRGPGMRGKRGMRGGHGRGDGARMMLRLADTNGDQAVTRAEFDAAITARFAKADSNGDGALSQAERQAAREAMRAAGKGDRGNLRGQ